MAKRLDNIDEDVKAFFRPAADAVLANADPHNAMAAALAALSGIMKVPQERRCALVIHLVSWGVDFCCGL